MALADYITQRPTIETARLYLRPLVPADVPALKEWLPDPSVYTYWGKAPGKAEKNPDLLFTRPEKPTKSFHLGIAEKDTDKVIGDIFVYLIENDRMASVAIRLSPARQRQGLGTEALAAMTRFCFANTELKRLWTKVDVRNTASQRMLEKCGYTREGLIRGGKMVNTWCDYYIYGILSSDRNSGERVMTSDITAKLTAKDNASACAFAERIISESREADTWYGYFDTFAALAEHPNSFVRNRALYILAALAKWDKEDRFDGILPAYLVHITDEKPITARQCVKALSEVGKAKPHCIPAIVKELQSADLSRYRDSMRPLIEKDIRETVKNLCGQEKQGI